MVFIPTHLYIKQHAITGKLYFGKTTRNPLKYNGSGKQWKRHIRVHGTRNIITLWYQLYDNVFDLVADAISMSNGFDVVNSNSWLNLKIENGMDGGLGNQMGESNYMHGKFHTKTTKQKISNIKSNQI